MRRSLIYYWRLNLAVLLGAAVATAVLTGALLVGDSVRASLRQLTLERLGQIDEALVTTLFFRQELAANLTAASQFKESFASAVPAIMLAGSAVHPTTKARASNINLLGIDQRFTSLFSSDSSQLWQEFFAQSTDQGFPALALNEVLQKELGAKVGDYVLIFVQQQTEIPRASLLGRRETADLVKAIRCKLTHIIPNLGIGKFGLRPHQAQPLNAYIALAQLQKALTQQQRVNALFVSHRSAPAIDSPVRTLHKLLHENLQLEDFGIRLRQHNDFVAIESAEIILNAAIVAAVNTAGAELQAPVQPVLTYLANSIECKGRKLPYSTVSAIMTPVAKIFGEFNLTNGSPVNELAADEILLNQWAAQHLEAQIGDTVKIAYYVVSAREQLETKNFSFRVAGMTPMMGFGADASLTPEFPGIHAAHNMHEWNPPFPVNLNLIRPTDEAYWDQYHALPKAFIALRTGQQLWNSRFGNLTSMRVCIAGASYEQLQKYLLASIAPEQMGFVFQPIKQQGIAAAGGATDFGMLFIGFSWFLILAAALLVGMLFRLGVEQRAKEVGILRAVGFTAHEVRRRFLQEGSLLVGIGGLFGLLGAVGYAALLMFGLRTWWADAVGAPALFLHVNAMSLVSGYIAAIAVTRLAIVLTLRQLGKISTPALLQGVTTQEQRILPTRTPQRVGMITCGLAVVMTIAAIFSNETTAAGWFFGSGTLLLITMLAMFAAWLYRRQRHDWGLPRTARMAIRYGARRPGRSLLCAALVGCACFVIVAVAANRRAPRANEFTKNSGTGGFALAAKADIPLHYDLNTKAGRDELGFTETDTALLNTTRIFSLRLLPGEDASCLNLYAPQKPRVLGVPADLVQRGGFQFQKISDATFQDDPWRLLENEMAPDVIPAFGDYNSVQWILHLGLGKDLVLRNDHGEEIKLRFVGLLANSIFQSEVLISEANFVKHFPETSGYAYFLIETPAAQSERVAQTVEQNLRDYGFDAVSTATVLKNFQAVENTYLSVFQTLGGWGLLLGTLGLGIILIRNVIERRGELALLRALGFRRATLMQMLLLENSFLLLVGIAIGGIAALVAVAPHLIGRGAQVPWFSLGLTLLAVLLVGLLASVVAVTAATRIALLPALKAE